MPYSTHTFSYLCPLKRCMAFHHFDLVCFPWKNSQVGEKLLVYSSLFTVVFHNCLSVKLCFPQSACGEFSEAQQSLASAVAAPRLKTTWPQTAEHQVHKQVLSGASGIMNHVL